MVYVRTDGNDADGGVSWDHAKITVQAGIDAAAISMPGRVQVTYELDRKRGQTRLHLTDAVSRHVRNIL